MVSIWVSSIGIGVWVSGISMGSIWVSSIGMSGIWGNNLGISISRSLAIITVVVSKTSITIRRGSIAIGSRVWVSSISGKTGKTVVSITISSIWEGSSSVGQDLGLSISLSLSLVVGNTLGDWVKSLSDWVQTSAGAEWNSGSIGMVSIWVSGIGQMVASIASISGSIWVSSIGKLGLS